MVAFAAFIGFKIGQKFAQSKNSEENEIYALVQGKPVGAKELLPKIKNDLVSLEKNKYFIKKQAVIDWITENAKKSEPQDKPTFSEEEFKAFIKERNVNYAKMTKKEQEDLMGNFLIFKKMMNQKKSVDDNIAKGNIVWKIPISYLPVTENVDQGSFPELGSANGKHHIVVFANYHCPYCPEVPKKIQALSDKFKDQLSVHFRFSFHESDKSIAYYTAVAALCADEQKKFTEVHHAFYAQPPLEEAKIIEIVKAQNLDMSKFETCYKSEKTKNNLQQEIQSLQKMNINGEALAYVDGYRIMIQEPIEDLENILNLD